MLKWSLSKSRWKNCRELGFSALVFPLTWTMSWIKIECSPKKKENNNWQLLRLRCSKGKTIRAEHKRQWNWRGDYIKAATFLKAIARQRLWKLRYKIILQCDETEECRDCVIMQVVMPVYMYIRYQTPLQSSLPPSKSLMASGAQPRFVSLHSKLTNSHFGEHFYHLQSFLCSSAADKFLF